MSGIREKAIVETEGNIAFNDAPETIEPVGKSVLVTRQVLLDLLAELRKADDPTPLLSNRKIQALA